MSTATEKYQLIKGKHFTVDADGNQAKHEVGAIIDLTEAQYKAFEDKFKPLAVIKAEAELATKTAEAATKTKKDEKAPETDKPAT